MSHQAWSDLADAVERVFATDVDPWREALKQIRSLYIADRNASDTGSVGARIAARDLIPESAYPVFDIETERRRLNLLGYRLTTAVSSDPDTLARFTRNIGQYWYEKGKASLPDFLAYCTNSNVNVTPLWTENYKDFYPAPLGPFVWDGGTWYPTTHVNIAFTSTSFDLDVASFVRFFYDLANYNVVIHHVTVDVDLAVESQHTHLATVLVREEVAGNFSVIGLPYASLFTGLIQSDANFRGLYLAYFEAEVLGWPGTATNTYPYNGGLRDQGSTTWDTLGSNSWDSLDNSWDGEPVGTISYEHTVTDLSSVQAFVVATEAYAQGTVVTEMTTSNDGTTWPAWHAVAPATARYVRIRWTVTGDDPFLMTAHAYFYAA